ncbi:MAG: hypothetical protein J0I13_02385 [Rhizobiales bacterium]|nr:hypothetical protein [Hyphomicrobiales bacterium]
MSGIGVQRILPRFGTGWRETNRAPLRRNSNDNDETPPSNPGRPGSETESGHVIDRNV